MASVRSDAHACFSPSSAGAWNDSARRFVGQPGIGVHSSDNTLLPQSRTVMKGPVRVPDAPNRAHAKIIRMVSAQHR